MDDIENYCFCLYRSQGMSYLRASKGNYCTISNLIGVAPLMQS